MHRERRRRARGPRFKPSITLVTCRVLCDTKVAYKSFSRRGEGLDVPSALVLPSCTSRCALVVRCVSYGFRAFVMEDVEREGEREREGKVGRALGETRAR